MKPRPYQHDAIEATLGEFERGVRGTIVEKATGTGKTVVLSHVADRMLQRGRVMFMVHEDQLLRQAGRKLAAITGKLYDIEKADQRASNLIKMPLVLASYQTLIAGKPRRLHRFDPNEFSCLIIDEAHRAQAKSYLDIIAYMMQNPKLVVFGVTATLPTATKQLQRLRTVFESVAYSYGIKEAVDDGYLVPIRQRYVPIDGYDLSVVSTSGGDFNQRQLGLTMEEEKVVLPMIAGIEQYAHDRKALVFAASIRQAEIITNGLNRGEARQVAALVTGETPLDVRAKILRQFRSGQLNYLINMGVYVEGFDEPSIETVVVCRPTKSLGRYKQMLGRGTRPLDGVVDGHETAEQRHAAIAASAKPYVEIIDFTGQCGRHKLVTSVQALSDIEPAQFELVEQEVRETLEKTGEAVDIQRAIREAQERIEERERERQRRERERWNNAQVVGAPMRSEMVDPFDTKSKPKRKKKLEGRDAQVSFLKSQGFKHVDNYTPGQIAAAMASVDQRRADGLCSYKVGNLLRAKMGYTRDEVRVMKASEASAEMARLKRNGWRPIPRRQEVVA